MRAGAIYAGCAAGLLVLGGKALSAQKANAAGADFAESSCKSKDRTGKKILVTYASRYGTTGAVAEAIGRTLCDAGFDVDTRPAKHVEDVGRYGAVVVGSAVIRASWLPDTLEFIRKNRDALARMPVAYFLTCITLHEDNAETRKLARTYMEPTLKAAPDVQPVDMGFFAGALDFSKLNMVVRMMMKAKGAPEGDFRNWNAIRSWTEGLVVALNRLNTMP